MKPKSTSKQVICDYCQKPAVEVSGLEIYPGRPEFASLRFWQCLPCGAYVGCHKNSDSVPMGRLANANLRRLKRKAHLAFDALWQEGVMTRSQAYSWLAERMRLSVKQCHIGNFDEAQCAKVISIITRGDFE